MEQLEQLEQLDISRLLQDIKKKVPKSDLNVKNQFLERKGKIAERVMVSVKKEKLQVDLAPADTVAQANAFFSHVDRKAFLSLEESGTWTVRPNLHFSFAQSHLIWAGTNWKTCEYFDYFSDGYRSLYGKKSRDELLDLTEQWESEGLMEGRKEIENLFNTKEYQSLNVVPGFLVSRRWDLDKVIEFERKGKLEEHIIEELAIPLATWGEEL